MTVVARIVATGRRALWMAGWPARTVLLGLVGLYRVTLSGLLGWQCRFHPSCSAYAEDAIRNRGAVVGSALTVWRVIRCSPLSRGGVDPAPGPAELGRAGQGPTAAAAVYEALIPGRPGGRSR